MERQVIIGNLDGKPFTVLKADAGVNFPHRIHLMSVGTWRCAPRPFGNGNFEMTSADLVEMRDHFYAGVSMVSGDRRLPINEAHEVRGKAAAWITDVTLENDNTELWGTVKWTKRGQQMLADDEYRYISPEWNDRTIPWVDPQDENIVVPNVLTGAGLTNIPLFTKLKPLMASRVTGGSDTSSNKQGDAMDVKEVRAKKPDELSEDEKTFLADHKTELTDDERVTFGLAEVPVEPAAPAAPVQPTPPTPTEPVAPAVPVEPHAGQQANATPQGLTAAQQREWDQMRADAAAGRQASQQLLRSSLTASVEAAVSRGAIVSDQLQPTVELLMASEGNRDQLVAFIAALPDHPVLASEQGDGGSNSNQSAQDELNTRAAKLVADSGGKLSYTDAVTGAMNADSALRDRVNAERSSRN